MGDAKKRGTREERIAAAEEKRRAFWAREMVLDAAALVTAAREHVLAGPAPSTPEEGHAAILALATLAAHRAAAADLVDAFDGDELEDEDDEEEDEPSRPPAPLSGSAKPPFSLVTKPAVIPGMDAAGKSGVFVTAPLPDDPKTS